MMDKITIGSDSYKTFWNDDHTFYTHIEPQPILATTYRAALFNTLARRQLNNPVVLISGGLDSELAAIVVHEYGIPYTLAHIEFLYEGQLINSHERYWTERVARTLGKNIQILSLDVGKFFRSDEYLQWSVPYKIRSPQIATHVWALSQITDPVIMGGNLTSGPKTKASGSPYHGVQRFWHTFQRTGVEMLQDSFELYTLSLALPKTLGREDNRSLEGKKKQFLFNSWGFSHYFEDRPKHTGFELLQQQYAVRGLNWNSMYRTDSLTQQVPGILTQFV